jgi:hypothetical protein
MAIDAEACGLSRAQIADLVGVSLPTVDSWLARTRLDRNLPVAALPLWVKATGSRRLLEWVAQECGLHVVDDVTLQRAELGVLIAEHWAREALIDEARERELHREVA